MPPAVPDLTHAALPTLGRILDDEQHPDWWLAYHELGRRHDQRVAPRVLRLIQTLTADDKRAALLTPLGFLLSPTHSSRFLRIAAALTAILADTTESPLVRGSAAEALGDIGHFTNFAPFIATAFDPLIAALRDPAAEVRLFAAFSLGKLGDPRAIPALQAVAKDRARVRGFGTVGKDAREAFAELRPCVC